MIKCVANHLLFLLTSFQQNQTELGEAFSDDDMPSDIDLNDPYFKEELDAIKCKKISKYEKQNSRKKDEEENAEVKHKKVNFSLLALIESSKVCF